jgi:integral membrane protein
VDRVRWPLRPIAVVEAVSYLALVGAVIWFRVFDGADLTSVIGPIHGVIFLVYAAAVLQARADLAWDRGRTLVVMFAGVIPLGGFWVAERVLGEHPA